MKDLTPTVMTPTVFYKVGHLAFNCRVNSRWRLSA